MKTKTLLLVLASMVVFNSCTVVKRKHLKGYHISSNIIQKKHGIKRLQNQKAKEKLAIEEDNLIEAPIPEESIDTINLLYQDLALASVDSTDVILDNRSISKKSPIKIIDEIEKYFSRSNKIDESKKDELNAKRKPGRSRGLIFSILGLSCLIFYPLIWLWPVFSILGLVISIKEKKQGNEKAKTGFVLGLIGTILFAVVAIAILLAVAYQNNPALFGGY